MHEWLRNPGDSIQRPSDEGETRVGAMVPEEEARGGAPATEAVTNAEADVPAERRPRQEAVVGTQAGDERSGDSEESITEGASREEPAAENAEETPRTERRSSGGKGAAPSGGGGRGGGGSDSTGGGSRPSRSATGHGGHTNGGGGGFFDGIFTFFGIAGHFFAMMAKGAAKMAGMADDGHDHAPKKAGGHAHAGGGGGGHH